MTEENLSATYGLRVKVIRQGWKLLISVLLNLLPWGHIISGGQFISNGRKGS